MSTRTLGIIRSMSNHWPQFMNYQCQLDTSSYYINAKPMGAILSAINANRTLAHILSMPNQWAQSRQLSMSTRTLAINRSMQIQRAGSQLLCFNENQITLNNVIKMESLYQLLYLRFKLKLIDVITISTSLSISHD